MEDEVGLEELVSAGLIAVKSGEDDSDAEDREEGPAPQETQLPQS